MTYRPIISGVVDFVIDCGADPTGVVDASPAFTLAMQKLKQLMFANTVPRLSLTLFFPPGKYKLASNFGVPFDFNGSSTSVRFLGGGQDSTFLEFPGGINAPALLNLFGFHMEGLTFIGLLAQPAPDCDAGFSVSAFGPSSVRNVRFANILASQYVALFQGQGWHFDTVLVTNCATLNAANGVLQSNSAGDIILDNVQFNDVGAINGFSTANKTIANKGPAWLHLGSDVLVNGGKTRLFHARGSFFDEGNVGGLWIKGTAGAPDQPVALVRVDGCTFNPSALAGNAACLHCEIVDHVIVNGLLDTGFHVVSTAPAVELVKVGTADLSNIEVNPLSASLNITADVDCNMVRVKDSPTLLAAQIITAAAMCEVEMNYRGTVASGVTVTIDTEILANTLVKFFAEVNLLGASPLDRTACLPSQAVFKNTGATTVLCTAVVGSTNPADSGDGAWLAAHAVTSELISGGGTPAITLWSVSAPNARLSITNNDVAQNARYQVTLRRRIAA